MANNSFWDRAEAAENAAASYNPNPLAPPPSGTPWWTAAESRAAAMTAPQPTQALAFASGPGLEPTTALALQLGAGVGAALLLLSPKWRRKIPPALLLIVAAGLVAYIQTKARPAALTLTVTPPPQTVTRNTPSGPVSGFYDSVGRFIYDQTGL